MLNPERARAAETGAAAQEELEKGQKITVRDFIAKEAKNGISSFRAFIESKAGKVVLGIFALKEIVPIVSGILQEQGVDPKETAQMTQAVEKQSIDSLHEEDRKKLKELKKEFTLVVPKKEEVPYPTKTPPPPKREIPTSTAIPDIPKKEEVPYPKSTEPEFELSNHPPA